MILPITVYGNPILKRKAQDIDADYPDLHQLIEDMFATMYHARGCGLAAPQIGKSINVFVIDTTEMEEEGSPNEPVKWLLSTLKSQSDSATMKFFAKAV